MSVKVLMITEGTSIVIIFVGYFHGYGERYWFAHVVTLELQQFLLRLLSVRHAFPLTHLLT